MNNNQNNSFGFNNQQIFETIYNEQIKKLNIFNSIIYSSTNNHELTNLPPSFIMREQQFYKYFQERIQYNYLDPLTYYFKMYPYMSPNVNQMNIPVFQQNPMKNLQKQEAKVKIQSENVLNFSLIMNQETQKVEKNSKITQNFKQLHKNILQKQQKLQIRQDKTCCFQQKQIDQNIINQNNYLRKDLRLKKVKHYLLKKYKRTYNKKIIYPCRKSVADNRARIKGRFVKLDKQ